MKIDRLNVAPRYTRGSPAWIPLDQAIREVALPEKKDYDRATSGWYGTDEKAAAEILGLSEIVEFRWRSHRARAWLIWDVLTGEFSEKREDDRPLSSSQGARMDRIRFKKTCIKTFGELGFPVPEEGSIY